jgi:hypothetical protein
LGGILAQRRRCLCGGQLTFDLMPVRMHHMRLRRQLFHFHVYGVRR